MQSGIRLQRVGLGSLLIEAGEATADFDWEFSLSSKMGELFELKFGQPFELQQWFLSLWFPLSTRVWVNWATLQVAQDACLIETVCCIRLVGACWCGLIVD